MEREDKTTKDSYTSIKIPINYFQGECIDKNQTTEEAIKMFISHHENKNAKLL